MVCVRDTTLRMCSLEDLLIEFSTGLLPHQASAAYLGDGIKDCGLAACRTVHLLIDHGGLHRSGGACSGWCTFVNRLGWLLVLSRGIVMA